MTFEPRMLLDTPLPPGRMITSEDSSDGNQILWLSDGPVAPGLWARIRAEHARTGLWPLLLDCRDPGDSEFRPWASGELSPERMSSPGDHDPAELLAHWWHGYTVTGEVDDVLPPAERLAVTAPFGQRWPGLAPGRPTGPDPDKEAAEYAEFFASLRARVRLGLVPAASGADALAVAGWDGPANYDNDTAKFSTVLRTWEQRFGARVVAVGFDTLHLSIATPPTQTEDALLIAAEHFAFCPDNIWQGSRPHTLISYADQLVDAHSWEFWWD
ncbi:DUF4253 domain-containing protein [Streptomyces sp. NPDC056500]|uniref:DUF4253 domain-containing protein n=1 Tax=Streptomyces sp. NPDC056500 TaxID=3345840 RepID=UPI0036808F7F